MSFVKISSKGQITLPSKIRAILGVNPTDKLELLVRNNEVVIQPVKTFKSFKGSLSPQKGYPRKKIEKEAASHVLERE